ncbi:class A sortase [Enterococcus faecalis]|uniref:sortase n=1 Tax=Enterococcus faecalis TaxID=1351 RepID=UPI0013D3A5ED|nr:class A sortase [Enterococcus faecalis]HAP3019612.1 class A sortase [Enterococcus faecalis]
MNKLFKYVSIILLIIGIMFLVYPSVKNILVSYMSKSKVQQMKKEHNEVQGTYDFENVTPITMKDVIEAIKEDLPAIGEIKIPSVELHLPIFKGVSNSAMAIGAGTLKENQQMGLGNYVLASHHMKNRKLLFTPLDRVTIGAKIYLSDGETTYQYNVVEKRVIKANETEVINNQEGKTLVTLITCHDNGEKRLLVVGELERTL